MNTRNGISLLIFIAFTLVGCGSDQAEPTATLQPTVAATATVVATPTIIPDPEIGEQLFNKKFVETSGRACHYCHKVAESEANPQVTIIGIANYAGDRVEGMSAEEYLRQSIIDPSAYVVKGFGDNMPAVYAEILSDEEINHLIAYMMILK